MSLEVHIDWAGETLLAGHLFSAERGGAVSFQYAREWLLRPDRFALDPTSLPLHPGMQHSANSRAAGRLVAGSGSYSS